jgi:hypothetical protein
LRPDWLGGDSAASDLATFRLSTIQPTPFQVDGDVVGDYTEVLLACVQDALRVGLPG